jgi:hypothetical protein
MKSNLCLLVITIVTFTVMTSCKKDTQDTSGSAASSDLSFAIQAQNKSFTLPVGGYGLKSTSSTSALITLDSARMLVSRIKFEAEIEGNQSHHDSLEIEYSWRGPRIVDLFDLGSTIGTITLPAGTYDKISLSVSSERGDVNGEPLLYLSGTYTNAAGTLVPVALSVSDPISFKTVMLGDTITAGSFTDFTSTVDLYLDELFSQVDVSVLDNATLTNGVLLISADVNTELYRTILHNLGKDRHCRFEHHSHHG